MKFLSPILAAMLFCLPCAKAIDTNGPASHGEEITVDLPTSLHKRNTSSLGLGLCVFTSIAHSAIYQNVPALQEFPRWLIENRIAGGGYPEKVDNLIPKICRDKGLPIPDYVQHTGGDVNFLKSALRTGRYPCVTYDGRDDFYSGSIAHMVNLVHLSEKWAVIQDNNRPGQYTWMTPEQFEARWRGNGGGWAFVLLAPPPSPIPINVKVSREEHMNSLLLASVLLTGAPSQWGSGNCAPVGAVSAESWHGWYDAGSDKAELYWHGEKIGTLNLETCEWLTVGNDKFTDLRKAFGFVSTPLPQPKGCVCDKNQCKCGKCPNDCVAAGEVALLPGDDPHPGGVIVEKIAGSPGYICNGRACTKLQAYQSMSGSLTDDSGKPTLTIVADEATQKVVLRDLGSHPVLSQMRSRMHVNAYTPNHWVVQQVGLAPGISYQKAPDQFGKAPVEWRFRSYAGPDALAEAIRKSDPNYRSDNDPDPTKKPEPKPEPSPKPDDKKPDDNPAKPSFYFGLLAFLAAIGLVIRSALK